MNANIIYTIFFFILPIRKSALLPLKIKMKESTVSPTVLFFMPFSHFLPSSSQQSHADLPSGQIQTTPPVLQPQDLAPASWHLPRRQAHWHRRHADDARVGGSGVRMTDGHPGRKSRGSETGNHQISCRIASVPQSTASHTSSSARRCHRARLCGRCHGAGARSVPPPHTQIEQPTPHRLLHTSSFDGS